MALIIDNVAVCGYTLIMGHYWIRPHGRRVPGRARRAGRIRFRLRGSTLGLTAASPADLVQQLERGFSFKTLQTLESRSGLAMSRLADIHRNSGANPGSTQSFATIDSGRIRAVASHLRRIRRRLWIYLKAMWQPR